MHAAWVTAFLDLPAERFDAATAFWCAVTGTTLSAPRGDEAQFATLVPPQGDAFLRVQRLDGQPGRVHLDVHTADVAGAVGDAVRAGAQLVDRRGYAILRSPAAFTFCLVSHHGESVRPAPLERPAGAFALVDQLCIDIPAPAYEAECAFWSALLGWPRRAGALEELSYLERPEGMPLRLLLQRLGPDDPGDSARAHLDLACDTHLGAVRDAHVALGATVVREREHWTTLLDPAGLPYCLTRRDPLTGRLAPSPA